MKALLSPAGSHREIAHGQPMLTGIVMGLAAGALWGLTFVAPRAVLPYGEIDLAILRYGAFGLTSLVLMLAHRRFRPARLSLKRMGLALWLGLSGYVIYYLFVAFSISLSGPVIAPLVIGALPLLLAVYGNWQDRNVPWSQLALPLACILLGLIVVKSGAIAGAATPENQRSVVLGFLLALGGLAVWFLYAISNAQAMRAADAPDAMAWTSLQGLGAAAGVVPLVFLAPLMGWGRMPELGLGGNDGLRLMAWALLTGVIASWVAQYFWTVASQRLPLALSAQLIVSETLFALLYGFLYEQRWPHGTEWAGAVLLVLGVFLGVRAFSTTQTSRQQA